MQQTTFTLASDSCGGVGTRSSVNSFEDHHGERTWPLQVAFFLGTLQPKPIHSLCGFTTRAEFLINHQYRRLIRMASIILRLRTGQNMFHKTALSREAAAPE